MFEITLVLFQFALHRLEALNQRRIDSFLRRLTGSVSITKENDSENTDSQNIKSCRELKTNEILF